MPRVYLAYTLTSSGFMMTLMGLCLALGRVQPSHPALAAFQPCDDSLCWYAIPLHAASSVLYRVLSEQGYQLIDTYTFTPDVVAESYQPHACTLRAHITRQADLNLLSLSACPDLRLGDVLAVFGAPDGLRLCENLLTLYFNPDHAVLVRLEERHTFSPFSAVIEITFYPLQQRGDWQGFAPVWHYQRLNGECQ